MIYAYSFDTNSVSRIDFIQSDVADSYTHLNEELTTEQEETEESYFGHALISLDELTDKQLREMELA